jgi:hypothetical protein
MSQNARHEHGRPQSARGLANRSRLCRTRRRGYERCQDGGAASPSSLRPMGSPAQTAPFLRTGSGADVAAIGVEQPRSIRFATAGENLHLVSDAHLSAGVDSLGMRGKGA